MTLCITSNQVCVCELRNPRAYAFRGRPTVPALARRPGNTDDAEFTPSPGDVREAVHAPRRGPARARPFDHLGGPPEWSFSETVWRTPVFLVESIIFQSEIRHANQVEKSKGLSTSQLCKPGRGRRGGASAPTPGKRAPPPPRALPPARCTRGGRRRPAENSNCRLHFLRCSTALEKHVFPE